MARKALPEGDPESGSASVLAVTGIGLLAVMAMLGLGVRVVVERRAVEDSIAEMRAYWAAMGHATYALSRVRYDGTGDKATDFANTVAKEIADGNGGKGTNLNATWRYPDVSGSYVFTVRPSAPADDGGPTAPGEVRLTFDFTVAAGAPASLRTVNNVRKVEFKFCLLPTAASACGNAPDGKGANYYLQRIYSLRRT